jgi:hypothetical protein
MPFVDQRDALLKLLGLDPVVNLADDVAVNCVEQGDDDLLAALFQLLLAGFIKSP